MILSKDALGGWHQRQLFKISFPTALTESKMRVCMHLAMFNQAGLVAQFEKHQHVLIKISLVASHKLESIFFPFLLLVEL